MTPFFVPDTPAGEQSDRAYEDLRHHAEVAAGRPPRSRRIYSLSCRRGGADQETRVGQEDVAGGTVYAIFDIGDRYVVYVPGGHEIVTKRQTYAVVEFD
ncbi:MAG: hypothetical protein V7607_5320 [Solirubrobacteraceae bacterium]